MTPQRWTRMKEIFGAALEQPEGKRAAFLDSACGGDAELRAEVERLLAGNEGPSLQSPAANAFTTAAALVPGDMVAHYRIEGPLGEGGMGVVYKATDMRLGRSVALKFASAQFSSRSEREARAVAALNHPNICTLHDVGPNYLVMELCGGETLAVRLQRGMLSIQDAVRYGAQIADALAAAHAQGIVHRDLKPGNVMLTKAGVKVLDFGLAKIEHEVAEEQQTHTMTAEGTILGTVQYMSPEQAQGKPADARSDIFSFGLVFYEMIAGKRAFEGSNTASIIAAILEREAPALEPEGLNRVVRACLAKDPTDRFQSARDLKRAIEWSASGDHERPLLAAAPDGARRPWLAWGMAAMATVGLASVSFLHFRKRPAAPPAPVRFLIRPPEGRSLGFPSVSPDGSKIAFNTDGRLWVHFLESGEERDLTAADNKPFWSPDSRFIGYETQGRLTKIEASGSGSPQTVADALGQGDWGGGTWNRDDVIVFADERRGLFRVPASGGEPVAVTVPDAARHETHFGPVFLPDGRHFLYVRALADEKKAAVYIGSLDAPQGQWSSKPVIDSAWQPGYAPSNDPRSGYLLFVRPGPAGERQSLGGLAGQRTLMAQPFDNDRLAVSGPAVNVAEQVIAPNGVGGAGLWAGFSASAGRIVVWQGAPQEVQLAWYDREGKFLSNVGEPGDYGELALAPDGKRLAVTRGRGKPVNIWLLDLSPGVTNTRFTFSQAVDYYPVWSPDGRTIIFSSTRDEHYNLYRRPADGSKTEELLLASTENKTPFSWSPDGRFLLYQSARPINVNRLKADLWVLPMVGGQKPFPFLLTDVNANGARFSPDGHWVAFVWRESGVQEVYVRPFSVNAEGTGMEAGGQWQVSAGGGLYPRWRGDGQELYFRGADGGLLAVDVATKPAFRIGRPHPVGPARDPHAPVTNWDVSADGKFLIETPVKKRPDPYVVILNWQSGLKK